jgi:hypothetical protein
MTNKVTTAALKKMTVQEFEALYNKAIANMGEYQKLLFLREMSASIKALVKDQAKDRAKAEFKRRETS